MQQHLRELTYGQCRAKVLDWLSCPRAPSPWQCPGDLGNVQERMCCLTCGQGQHGLYSLVVPLFPKNRKFGPPLPAALGADLLLAEATVTPRQALKVPGSRISEANTAVDEGRHEAQLLDAFGQGLATQSIPAVKKRTYTGILIFNAFWQVCAHL